MPSNHSVDVTGFDTVRLRRGVSLAVLGIGVTASGLAIGWDFATGARFTILGPLLLLAGVGYAGSGAVPVLVARIVGPDATWGDPSLSWQLGTSALIAAGLFVLYLVVWSLLP